MDDAERIRRLTAERDELRERVRQLLGRPARLTHMRLMDLQRRIAQPARRCVPRDLPRDFPRDWEARIVRIAACWHTYRCGWERGRFGDDGGAHGGALVSSLDGTHEARASAASRRSRARSSSRARRRAHA